MTSRSTYLELEAELERRYDVRWIRRYRGAAYVRSRRLEIPRPRGPVSAAIALHEVGHVELGHAPSSGPRCVREYEAWLYALDEMRRRGILVSTRVREMVDRALAYALHKALRRGLREVPRELLPWAPRHRGGSHEAFLVRARLLARGELPK